MNHETLDYSEEHPSKKSLLYILGSILSIGSLLIFIITTKIILSLIICGIGTALIWFSPIKRKEKIYALTPLVGLLGVYLSYWYVFSL
jgi:hypothetical protein